MKNRIFSFLLVATILLPLVVDAAAARPKGTTRFQTLSAQKSPLPSAELDAEFNNTITAINSLSLNQNASEWYDTSLPAVYVNTTQFTVPGDHIAEFLATRRVKFDITGSSVYSEVVSAIYSTGPNTTTITIVDGVLQNPIVKVYYSIVVPLLQGGSVSAKMATGYYTSTSVIASTIPVRDGSGKLAGDVLGNAATSTNATNHIAATTGAEHGATSQNTANMIIRRDASGNFTAGTMTGTATNAITLAGKALALNADPDTVVLRNSSGQITGAIVGSATSLNGYAQDTGTAANSISVRDSRGDLPGTLTNRGASVKVSAGVSVPHISTAVVAFTVENFDTDNIHDNVTNNTRLTVPSGYTKARLTATGFYSQLANGYRYVDISKNGVSAVAWHTALASGFDDGFSISSGIIPVSAGDYFELKTQQNSGSTAVIVPMNFTIELSN